MDIRPNHTIYINNINDKVKKEGKCTFSQPAWFVSIYKAVNIHDAKFFLSHFVLNK